MTPGDAIIKRAILYARIGAGITATAEEQLESLRDASEQYGWRIVAVHTDTARGSTINSRDRRPGLDAVRRRVTRGEVDVVAASSICRLGRSLPDLLHILGELRAHDVGLYLHQQAIDTATPSGRTLFKTVDIFTAYERAMARERVIAGQRRAALAGVRIGRPPLSSFTLRQVRAALDAGRGIRETARLCGISATAVHRIKVEIATVAEGVA